MEVRAVSIVLQALFPLMVAILIQIVQVYTYNTQKYKIASLIYVSLLYFRGMFIWVINEYKC